MNDWAVFWIMVLVVWVLWAAAARVHHARHRAEQRMWAERYAPRRGGPPRVVP